VRIVFFGSGAFAIPSFEAVLGAGHTVVAAFTQPDREKGRGRALTPPPLKPVAQARGVKLFQPRRIREPEALAALFDLKPEIQVVVAYGQILPKAVIDAAKRGTLNVHASLLPRFRGAAPIQWAIVRGESETGVTTMQIDEGLDTGPLLLARSTPIGPAETAAQLEPRLAQLGAALLLETLSGIEAGTLTPTPQDDTRATLAPIIKKEDGRVDWRLTAVEIDRRVRGFTPWPGAATTWRGQRLKLLRARPAGEPGAEPSAILGVLGESLVVACGAGTRLLLDEVQPEGRRAMSGAAFAAGARLGPDARFE
jgi:methionyl-tRNA formyltransferase